MIKYTEPLPLALCKNDKCMDLFNKCMGLANNCKNRMQLCYKKDTGVRRIPFKNLPKQPRWITLFFIFPQQKNDWHVYMHFFMIFLKNILTVTRMISL